MFKQFKFKLKQNRFKFWLHFRFKHFKFKLKQNRKR